MKEIPLTQGKFALVDDEDFEYLNQWSWYCMHGRAARQERIGKIEGRISCQRTVHMHRVVAKTPDGFVTDHINRNQLDNRKSNLRICTQAENMRNSKLYNNNKTGIKGVHFRKESQNYVAKITVGGKQIALGYFENLELAAAARQEASKQLHGEFARAR